MTIGLSGEILIPKGDKGYYLIFTLQDADGVARNLTGYTVKFKVWSPGVPGTLLVNDTCDVPLATIADGICRWLVTATGTATVGEYHCEVELTATGIIDSHYPGRLRITESG